MPIYAPPTDLSTPMLAGARPHGSEPPARPTVTALLEIKQKVHELVALLDGYHPCPAASEQSIDQAITTLEAQIVYGPLLTRVVRGFTDQLQANGHFTLVCTWENGDMGFVPTVEVKEPPALEGQ